MIVCQPHRAEAGPAEQLADSAGARNEYRFVARRDSKSCIPGLRRRMTPANQRFNTVEWICAVFDLSCATATEHHVAAENQAPWILWRDAKQIEAILSTLSAGVRPASAFPERQGVGALRDRFHRACPGRIRSSITAATCVPRCTIVPRCKSFAVILGVPGAADARSNQGVRAVALGPTMECAGLAGATHKRQSLRNRHRDWFPVRYSNLLTIRRSRKDTADQIAR